MLSCLSSKYYQAKAFSHLGDDRLGHAGERKMAKFSFFLQYVCDILCDNVDQDDSEAYDMITKAFVKKKSQNVSLIAPKKFIPKKSRDENIRLIPSRKIPGSRDFAKIPSRKSRD